MAVKVSFNLPEPVVGALKELARQRGATVTEVLRDSISNEVFLNKQVVETGARILLETPDRKVREIVFPEMVRHIP